jgi:stage II sporulation protein M
MIRTKNKTSNITVYIKNHVKNNIREYMLVTLMFLVGIFFGVMFINNNTEVKNAEVSDYINNYVEESKEKDIATIQNFGNEIKENIILAIALWFAGTTIVGIPIVFGIVLYRGFCLGYTISACTFTLGFSKGIVFILISMLLQNILFIPAILAIGVSGIKLYKTIVKDKKRDNIKGEIIRHTIFSIMMLAILIISAFVKIYISGNMIENLIKYF